jgi:hypothetical protein
MLKVEESFAIPPKSIFADLGDCLEFPICRDRKSLGVNVCSAGVSVRRDACESK